jgi:tRNA A-37 threonylcarbamoyl transferase component Bud32
MSLPSCPNREQLADFVQGRGEGCDAIAEHVEHCPACEAAVRELEAAPDSVIRTLRMAKHQDSYAAERECRRATAQVAALGRDQSLSELSPHDGAEGSSPSAYARPEEGPWPVHPFPLIESTSADRFRILRKHAEGALGQVSVALDEELHREVALKEIKERLADNPESRARFLVEAEITGRLEHPGIVPIYSLGIRANGRPFYAMRLIRGQSLKDAIAEFHGGFQPPSANATGAAALVRQAGPAFDSLEFRQLLGRFTAVCNAIAYAHSSGVLHRDIKPGNIMLGNYGETLVVDWGLAKAQKITNGLVHPTRDLPAHGAVRQMRRMVGAVFPTP